MQLQAQEYTIGYVAKFSNHENFFVNFTKIGTSNEVEIIEGKEITSTCCAT